MNVLKGNSMKNSFKDGQKEVDKNEIICDKNRRQKVGNILRIDEYSRQSLNAASTIGLDCQITTRKSRRTLQSSRQSRHVNYACGETENLHRKTAELRLLSLRSDSSSSLPQSLDLPGQSAIFLRRRNLTRVYSSVTLSRQKAGFFLFSYTR